MDFGKYLSVSAISEDGREVTLRHEIPEVKAENRERMDALIRNQIEKTSGHYSFSLVTLSDPGELPLMKASELNAMRRSLASALDGIPCKTIPLPSCVADRVTSNNDISYKSNVSNHLSRQIYLSGGSSSVEKAFEQTRRQDAELMRTKYCVKYELGLCPSSQGAASTGPLFLVNNGRRFRLGFDCPRCEMTVQG